MNSLRRVSRASRDVDYFGQRDKQPRPSMMQDEFFTGGGSSPKNHTSKAASSYGKRPTMVRFTESLG